VRLAERQPQLCLSIYQLGDQGEGDNEWRTT